MDEPADPVLEILGEVGPFLGAEHGPADGGVGQVRPLEVVPGVEAVLDRVLGHLVSALSVRGGGSESSCGS